MSQAYIGEIRMFGGNFAPRNFALCNGQIIATSQNTALFSVLGTAFGGNGQTTFGLPNLQGCTPIGFGSGPGLSQVNMGARMGTESVALTSTEIPSHSHSLSGIQARAALTSPAGAQLAVNSSLFPYATPAAAVAMSPNAVQSAGGGQPHENRQPFQVVNFIIAIQGIFPPRT